MPFTMLSCMMRMKRCAKTKTWARKMRVVLGDDRQKKVRRN